MNIDSYIQKEEIPTTTQWIGIAPMAKHELKRWDISNIYKLIPLINDHSRTHFFLFGGGQVEKDILEQISSEFSNSTNIAGSFEMGDEIALISKMSFMITMDSGNMHISSLIGVPTISIWGATHPKIGFGALNQPEKYSIQIIDSELSCRPCTIYGKGSCRRGDLACLKWITPEKVVEELKSLELLCK